MTDYYPHILSCHILDYHIFSFKLLSPNGSVCRTAPYTVFILKLDTVHLNHERIVEPNRWS